MLSNAQLSSGRRWKMISEFEILDRDFRTRGHESYFTVFACLSANISAGRLTARLTSSSDVAIPKNNSSTMQCDRTEPLDDKLLDLAKLAEMEVTSESDSHPTE
jgi:hypothetical protein